MCTHSNSGGSGEGETQAIGRDIRRNLTKIPVFAFFLAALHGKNLKSRRFLVNVHSRVPGHSCPLLRLSFLIILARSCPRGEIAKYLLGGIMHCNAMLVYLLARSLALGYRDIVSLIYDDATAPRAELYL